MTTPMALPSIFPTVLRDCDVHAETKWGFFEKLCSVEAQPGDGWFPKRGGFLRPGPVSVSERSLVTLSQLRVCSPIMVIDVRVAVTVIDAAQRSFGSTHTSTFASSEPPVIPISNPSDSHPQ